MSFNLSKFSAWGPLVHPNVEKFWKNLRQNKDHPFSQHGLFAPGYGHDLSKGSYEHTNNLMNQRGMQGAQLMQAMQQMQQTMNKIMQIEAAHRPQLEQLAKQVVSQTYGIPAEDLNTKLSGSEVGGEHGIEDKDVDINDAHKAFDQGIEDPNKAIGPEDREEINKRITLNALKQGASTNDLLTMHNLVRPELDAIDPQLMPLYDKVTALTHIGYWAVDTGAMTPEQLAEVAGASEKLDEQGNVHAKATTFPFLLHELSKGVMERFQHVHHMQNLPAEQANFVRKHADDARNEVPLIQAGPQLWRALQEVIKKTPGLPAKPVILARLQYLSNQELNTLFMRILDKDPNAGQFLLDLFQQEPEQEQEQMPQAKGFAQPQGGGFNEPEEDNFGQEDPDWWKKQ